ncbi:acyl-CoA dehydrogenase family protein [Paenibacillus campi]|uniref:acyl-CoA dehydrogenase family protein n=1 Tax=Paenibacillus campi TaxID=3106031 RepID=UPI002AFF3C65|nr:acyl-CoA dehydrogenase family protein [Paenibacillus sp. SGZ-1014]
MNSIFTAEHRQFRAEVRALIDHYDGYSTTDLTNDYPYRELYRQLGRRGWLAINWPIQYGGLAKSTIEAAIITEELGLSNFADRPHNLTIDIAGQFLLLEGSQELKHKYLPDMARGTSFFSILYSERQAGSDLAALTTHAQYKQSDGVYRIYGSKIYNMYSDKSDFAICAVKTKTGVSKYDGISLFVVPLKHPNVSINVLPTISEEQFCEVILDGVEVSEKELIGALHKGWSLLNKALMVERTGLDFNIKIRRWLHIIRDQLMLLTVQDERILNELVQLELKAVAGQFMSWSTIYKNNQHVFDEQQSAMSKFYNSELAKEVYELILHMMTGAAKDHTHLLKTFDSILREIPGLTLAAGTSEIMLHIISSSFAKV